MQIAPLAVLLASLWQVQAADNTACTVHSEGKYYDLNPLASSQDYLITTPGSHKFRLNVCKAVSHETWNLNIPNPETVAGFIRGDRGDFAIGRVNSTLVMMGSDPLLVLSDGSQCKNSELKASSAVRFICDTSVFGAGEPRLLAQLPPGSDESACAFVIEWRTHYACPSSLPGDTMGIFVGLLVALVLLLMLYLVVGTLYSRYVLKRRGFDQIPQPSLESCREHIAAMCTLVLGCFNKTSSSSLAHQTRINPHSHQWGVDGRPRAPRRSDSAGIRRFGGEEEEAMLGEDERPDPRSSPGSELQRANHDAITEGRRGSSSFGS